ncbi:PhoU domain protein [compost metagenome]
MIGANIGSGLLAFLTASLQTPAGRRVALGSLLYKLLGLIVVIPLLNPLVSWLDSLEWRPAELVIGFHLLYNSLRCVLMLPTVGPMARFCNWLLPDRPDTSGVARPRHLDATALATPSLALANAVRETLRIGDLIETMLSHLLEVLRSNQPALSKELRRLDDDVDALYSAVKLYLAQVPREALSEQDSRRWAEIIELAVNLERAGDIIERMLGKVQDQKTAQRHSFSDSGLEELASLHGRLMVNLRLGLSVFLSGDPESARQLLREKRRFRAQERRLAHAHVGRLHRQVVQSIETSSLHLELIGDMKRLNSLFCSSAYVVLESADTGALHAEEVGGE